MIKTITRTQLGLGIAVLGFSMMTPLAVQAASHAGSASTPFSSR